MARHNHKRKKPTANDQNRRVQAADPSYDRRSKTYTVTPPDEEIALMPDHHPTERCVKIDKGRHG